MSSRAIKPAETAKADLKGVKPVATVVAYDGIAVIVHPTNPVKALSLAQLQAIYTGKITNWSSLGGPQLKIVVLSRDSSSGTYEAFEDLALKKQKVRPDALNAASNQAIAKTVAQTPGAIGYIGLGYLSPRVKALSVDGQACTRANIMSKRYALSRPLYLYTNGQPAGSAKRFIDFILSAEGQKLITEEGFVSVRR
ncbi:MAG: Phosphate-binding protein PstS 1 precursor [Deltaproteobacteria bacterium ADurb.Bin510]|nr:MAG: Phosphate-binding protein PstS 1 precursor [Deltaproteobacteria bacterium ADurb.Bin510]